MNRRILPFLLPLTMLAACSSSAPEPASPDTSLESETLASIPQTDEITFEPHIIYDGHDVEIVAEGLTNNENGQALGMSVHNHTDQTIVVQGRDLAVNGMMIKPYFDIAVGPDTEAGTSMTFFYDDLKRSGVDTIHNMEFTLILLDDANETIIDQSEPITLIFSESDPYVRNKISGDILLDANAIRIAQNGLKEIDIKGPAIEIQAENNSDVPILITVSNFKVNGQRIEPLFSCTITPGKRAVDLIQMFDLDLEEAGIDSVESVTFDFHIVNADTLETIVDAEPVELTFNN